MQALGHQGTRDDTDPYGAEDNPCVVSESDRYF